MIFSIVSSFTNNAAQAANIQSVNALVVPSGVILKHVIFVDGPQFKDHVDEVLARNPAPDRVERHVIHLPFNTGGSRDGKPGYLCHLINAASSFLVDTDWISFLDEDNYVTENHLELVAKSITQNPKAKWGFTLRTVFNDEEALQDVVESMGNIRNTVCAPGDFLVDTNCFYIQKDLAQLISQLWAVKARQRGEMEADRKIARVLMKEFPNCASTRDHTVMYRLGNRDDSVQMSFFKTNTVQPWKKENKDVYVFFFDNVRTQKVLDPGVEKNPLSEWCMTMLDEFHGHGFNLINGYNSFANSALPADALCFIVMCHPQNIPLEQLKSLKETTHKDLTRVLYTVEGPNFRHRAQWSKSFLLQYFDKIMTCANMVLDDDDLSAVYCPHNARFLKNSETFVENKGGNHGSIAMVLEPRPNKMPYTIDGFDDALNCLDGYRIEAAKGLPELTVYGNGWSKLIEQFKEDGIVPPHLGHDKGKYHDDQNVVDIYKKYDFVLIFENTDASGYVSEKFLDAMIAGAIPIYYGKSLSKNDYDILEGKGTWWIDIQDIIVWGEREYQGLALGELIRLYMDSNGLRVPTMISLMKKRVSDAREKVVLSRGARAVASCLANI